MKKLMVLISVAMYFISGIARDIPAPWLMTVESRLDCKKISLGIHNARVILKNGEKKTVPISTIRSYALDGKEFTNLPIYRDGNPTGRSTFMELVGTMGELGLYRIEMNDIVASDLKDKQYRYFLYKGDKLHLELDEKSLPNVSKAFGLSYSYL